MRLALVVVFAVLLSGCLGPAPVTEVQQPPLSKNQFRTDLVSCSFDSYPGEGKGRFTFFFKAINMGENPTKASAKVCLALSKSLNPHCINLNQVYRTSEVLWGEINWTDGRRGQEWFVESPSTGRQDQDYRLFYTEDPYNLEDGAVMLASGTTDGCRPVSH